MLKARKALNITGWKPVKKGTILYDETKRIYNKG